MGVPAASANPPSSASTASVRGFPSELREMGEERGLGCREPAAGGGEREGVPVAGGLRGRLLRHGPLPRHLQLPHVVLLLRKTLPASPITRPPQPNRSMRGRVQVGKRKEYLEAEEDNQLMNGEPKPNASAAAFQAKPAKVLPPPLLPLPAPPLPRERYWPCRRRAEASKCTHWRMCPFHRG